MESYVTVHVRTRAHFVRVTVPEQENPLACANLAFQSLLSTFTADHSLEDYRVEWDEEESTATWWPATEKADSLWTRGNSERSPVMHGQVCAAGNSTLGWGEDLER